MRQIYALIFCLYISLVSSHVGVNTALPKATPDITGQPSDTSKLDGLITLRMTGDQLGRNLYPSQAGAIMYVPQKIRHHPGKLLTGSGR